MTNEEAISALKNTAWIGTDKKVGEVEKAIMMAVEALKGQLLREDATKDTTNDDIISRQAAIELIERMKPYHQEADDIAEMIANMPSAQPEDKCGECDAWNKYKNYTRPDIVYCKDCICGHGEVWLSGNESADFYGYCGRTQLRVVAYDYCSYAKRRTDEND